MFPTFISGTYWLSTQSHLHCTILRSASDTVWYTEKPGFSVPHVFIYRVRLSGWLINIAHSDILCDHVPDFDIDGFNVFSLAFWKATSKTFRALKFFAFLIRSFKKIQIINLLPQLFYERISAEVFIATTFHGLLCRRCTGHLSYCKAGNLNRTDDYGVQIHGFATKLYRLSRGKAVPFSFLSVTVLYATVFWFASENTFAETPQLKLCKTTRNI